MFVVLGNTTVDLFISGMEQIPGFDGDEFTTSSLTFCNEPLTMVLGGNGANSAFVLASLSAPTALCSAIGQDELGDIVAGWLAKRGVDLRGLERSLERATPTTTVVMDERLNRIAFHHPGALMTYSQGDIPAVLLEEATALLITGYTLLSRFRTKGFADVLRAAREGGAITAMDVGPAIGEPARLEEIRPLLQWVDYLITNEHELAVCTGTDDLAAGIAQLQSAGATVVIVKRGPAGATVHRDGTALDVPAFPVEARFTVGAGDSFNAGLLYAIRQGWELERSVLFGNATAALVVSAARGVLGSPDREQVEALMAKGQP